LFAKRLFEFNRKTGQYDVNLDDGDRTIMRELVPQFTEWLNDPTHPMLYRVFPPAYSDPAHVEQQDEYRRLMQDDLVESHRGELELVVSTADAKTLTEEQLLAWSRAINSIRLIIGTYLDVSEEDEGRAPETADESAYRWLTVLLGEAIDALSRQN
jgi:hypothetical protein